MNKIDIPPISKKLSLIAEFEKLDPNNYSVDSLMEPLQEIIKGYAIKTYEFSPHLLIYRGIKYDSKPSFFKDLIYPPKEKAKINRASHEGEQMFYCSTIKKAPLYELNLAVKDKLVLVTWRTVKSLLCNNVGYTKSNFQSLGSKREIYEDFQIEGKNINIEDNNIVADFLARNFCRQIAESNLSEYKKTIAIAMKHNLNYQFHGLLYPTIQMNAEADNFALNKKVIDDDFLEFEQAEYIEILSIENNTYKYRILDIANDITGSLIQWKNAAKSWTVSDDSEELFFTEEFGQLEAYTANGDQCLSDS